MGLVILTGASGAGKTAIAEAIAARFAKTITVLHFDSIGVPPAEEMISQYRSGEGWQRAMTFEWMKRLAEERRLGRRILFEGQTRQSFLAEAAMGLAYVPILIDCDDETRIRRLSTRGQPELADDNMMGWARYLRREAAEFHCEILDTSALTLDDCVAHVLGHING